MRCPVCNHADTRVVDSRLTGDETSIRRRRECDRCEYRFSTLEEVELLDISVVKRDGGREGYSRDKVERGLKKALEKRSYTDADFRSLVSGIERDIQRRKTDEITSAALGEVVMNRLKAFDKVAYIRFASVYRAFEDVKTFQDELTGLLRQTKRPVKSKKRKIL